MTAQGNTVLEQTKNLSNTIQKQYFTAGNTWGISKTHHDQGKLKISYK